MKTPRNNRPGCERSAHARDALDRAQQLSDARPANEDKTAWFKESLHVGDLSALAIASALER
jgi:hypothetical protein